MATLARAGVRLKYEVHGPGEGRPLLLTHGFAASRQMWQDNVASLSRHRPVITWDLRGHGSSDAPEDLSQYSHDVCLEDMAGLLDHVGAEAAHIGGMSLGGYLSMAFRLRFPERVASLLLVDTGPGFRDDEARAGWNAWARERAEQLEREGLGALGSPEARAAAHRHGVAGLAQAARGTLVQRDGSVLESLPQVDVPTLIVVGERDTQFLRAANAMEKRIPGARKVVLQDAGHAANMDAPEEFNRVVEDFLAGVG